MRGFEWQLLPAERRGREHDVICVFFCLCQQFVSCKQKNWVLSNYNNHNISTKTCFMGNLCCEVGMNENWGGDKSRNPGPRTPFTAYVSHFSCPAVLLLDRPLYVYSYSCCHILVCARCS